jgi:hypothetical protein
VTATDLADATVMVNSEAGLPQPRVQPEDVAVLRNGEPLDRAVANQLGQFAMVPPDFPPGTTS